MCKTKQIHKGGWALESCSNNDSKPPLPDSVGTKEMLPGGFGVFYATEATADGEARRGMRRK